jgi:hypothetical protein
MIDVTVESELAEQLGGLRLGGGSEERSPVDPGTLKEQVGPEILIEQVHALTLREESRRRELELERPKQRDRVESTGTGRPNKQLVSVLLEEGEIDEREQDQGHLNNYCDQGLEDGISETIRDRIFEEIAPIKADDASTTAETQILKQEQITIQTVDFEEVGSSELVLVNSGVQIDSHLISNQRLFESSEDETNESLQSSNEIAVILVDTSSESIPVDEVLTDQSETASKRSPVHVLQSISGTEAVESELGEIMDHEDEENLVVCKRYWSLSPGSEDMIDLTEPFLNEDVENMIAKGSSIAVSPSKDKRR